jgi:hypothetical protein
MTTIRSNMVLARGYRGHSARIGERGESTAYY